LAAAGCATRPPEAIDASLAAEIQNIRAIDNHAHPVRPTAQGEAPDHYYDALPVENLEPQSDPEAFQPGLPIALEAARAMNGARGNPARVLDVMGVETMLANRVEMGSGMEPPRFRWVPYVDALIFPLDTSKLAARNSDRKAFFALEDVVRRRFLTEAGLQAPPASLSDYLAKVVTPTLERHKQGGALAEKFEAAYLRSLAFDPVDRAVAERIYARGGALSEADYKPLQDFLFRYIAAECGRLGMAIDLHTQTGAGGYFEVAGANPLLLESVLNDPSLRKTNFVMIHGGWPFTHEIGALLTKPNAYLDFSNQTQLLPPTNAAASIREWLELVPKKVMFGTDAYPYSKELGWEETGWIAAHNGRQALAITLTGMMRDGEITRERASQLAHMVLHDNAKNLYGL
jgi:hypothetical protein